MRFPDGKRFAFTILDDTDDATLENVRPVYDRLRDLGFRTTKTVWPMDCPEGSRIYSAADTLQRQDYLAYVRSLIEAGFELGSHGATMETSGRERTQQGLGFLEREFGFLPRVHANHGQNRENVYWGFERFQSPLIRPLISIVGQHPRGQFTGETEDSPHYWGDLCQAHFDYVRNFTFSTLNMLECNPEMPYRVASTPQVRHWFSTSDASDVNIFRRIVNRAALERLESAGGIGLISTHLGKGFAREGKLDPGVDETLRYLADRPGWYVPVSTLLDHLRDVGGSPILRGVGLFRLELRYLLDQLRERLTTGR
jgi:hypothetical protein